LDYKSAFTTAKTLNRRDGETQSYFSAALRLCGLYLPNLLPTAQVCDATEASFIFHCPAQKKDGLNVFFYLELLNKY